MKCVKSSETPNAIHNLTAMCAVLKAAKRDKNGSGTSCVSHSVTPFLCYISHATEQI